MFGCLYQNSPPANPPLRIGLLLDSAGLPACYAEVAGHILDSNFARVELLVFNGAPPRKQPPESFLFRWYHRMELRYANDPNDPLRTVDCTALLRGIESCTVVADSGRFPSDAIDLIRRKRLDVLVRFGFDELSGDILAAAKYGVWAFRHEDDARQRGGPTYFWEMYESNPLCAASLEILAEPPDPPKVLYQGVFATWPTIWVSLNRLQPYWGASTFVIQKLRELHEHGWERVARNLATASAHTGRKPAYSAPTNTDMLRWFGRLALKKPGQHLRRPVTLHWRIAMRSGGPALPDAGPVPDMSGFKWIESPEGHFYADPFLITEGGRTWAFFEDLAYAAGRGAISCAEVTGGVISQPVVVLERPYHLSYPCVFRAGDEVFMIPETSASGAVELYRAIHFPDRWEYERNLLNLRAVDSTIYHLNQKYWLFVTLEEPRGSATQLWLFSADSLDGAWQPHPMNPISTDVRNSRGAGAIFEHRGRLFRPSQDCSRAYGYSFTLNDIGALDERNYCESPRVTVDPSWSPGLIATHSYACAGGVEIVDGCMPVPSAKVLDRSRRGR